MIPPVSRYTTSTLHVVTSRDSLATARELMTTHAIHHLPVVDGGRLVGIVSDNDLARMQPYDEHVSDAMTSDVTQVDAALPLDEAVALMNAGRLGSLVVTSRKPGIRGIFTITDAMRAFAELLRSNDGGTAARLTCAALVERGDSALHDDDSSALARVARQLAKHMGDPLTGRLDQFARTCVQPGAHGSEWNLLRRAICDRIAIAGT